MIGRAAAARNRTSTRVAVAQSPSAPPNALLLDGRRTTDALLSVAFGLAIVSLLGQTMRYSGPYDHGLGIIDLFNVDAEGNVPTLFSTMLLGMTAMILFTIAAHPEKQEMSKRYWWALMCGFAFMACDEALLFHERLSKPMQRLLGNDSNSFLHFAWVIPGGIVAIVCAVCFVDFLRKLPRRIRTGFISAGAIYLTGALGLEMLGASYSTVYSNTNFQYQLYATLEELLEMCGIILFIRYLLMYLAEQYRHVNVTITA
jgi:hypothetical protein